MPEWIPKKELENLLAGADASVKILFSRWYFLDSNNIDEGYSLCKLTPETVDEWNQLKFTLIQILDGVHLDEFATAGRSRPEWELSAGMGLMSDKMLGELISCPEVFVYDRNFTDENYRTTDSDFFDIHSQDLRDKLTRFRHSSAKAFGGDREGWKSFSASVDDYKKMNTLYIGEFKEDFCHLCLNQLNLINQCKKSWDRDGMGLGICGDVLTEIFNHSWTARNFCNSFFGDSSVLSRIVEAIEAINKPQISTSIALCVCGSVGCGKSSFVAKLAAEIFRSKGPTDRRPVIVRFCGTTLESSSTLPLLQSICHQIHFALWAFVDVDLMPSDHHACVLHFQTLLRKYPVVLLLDAVDSLKDSGPYEELEFLKGVQLHPNTKIVISVTTTESQLQSCEDNELNQRQYNATSSMILDSVALLPLRREIVEFKLNRLGRRVRFGTISIGFFTNADMFQNYSEVQMEYIVERCSIDTSLWYLDLCVEMVRLWHSSDLVQASPLNSNNSASLVMTPWEIVKSELMLTWDPSWQCTEQVSSVDVGCMGWILTTDASRQGWCCWKDSQSNVLLKLDMNASVKAMLLNSHSHGQWGVSEEIDVSGIIGVVRVKITATKVGFKFYLNGKESAEPDHCYRYRSLFTYTF